MARTTRHGSQLALLDFDETTLSPPKAEADKPRPRKPARKPDAATPLPEMVSFPIGDDGSILNPGEALRAARIRHDFTGPQIAERLHVAPRVISALEEDAYEDLPAPVFVRAYLRAYARLVAIDGEALVQAYDRHAGRAETPGPSIVMPGKQMSASWPRTLILGVSVVLAMILLSGGIWIFYPDDSTPLAGPGSVSAGPASSATATARRAAPVAPAPVRPERTEHLPGLEVARITTLGEDELDFFFSQPCWVEVRDHQGRTLYSALGHADDRLRLIGQGPLRVRLGYAPGVALRFNGQPVPLAAHTRDQVATLVLGQ